MGSQSLTWLSNTFPINRSKEDVTQQGWQFPHIMSQFGDRGLVHAILFPRLSPTVLWLLAKCVQTQAGLFRLNSALCLLVYVVTGNHFFRSWLTISSDGRLNSSRECCLEECSSKQWNALSLAFFFFNWQCFSFCSILRYSWHTALFTFKV